MSKGIQKTMLLSMLLISMVGSAAGGMAFPFFFCGTLFLIIFFQGEI